MGRYLRYTKNVTGEIDKIFSIAVRKEIEVILIKKAEAKIENTKSISIWEKVKLFVLLLLNASK